ncbi:MAG: hypothetical protein MZU79_08650, partial [Anaerotruncus sp.]|nr:hypothetical protein [Anaerotruncus sp.]
MPDASCTLRTGSAASRSPASMLRTHSCRDMRRVPLPAGVFDFDPPSSRKRIPQKVRTGMWNLLRCCRFRCSRLFNLNDRS